MLLSSKIFAVLISLVFIGNLLVVVVCDRQQEALKYTLRDPYVARLVHKVEIYNDGHSKTSTNLLVPLISNDTARHYSYIYSISPTPDDILTDEFGNHYAQWKTQISRGESFRASISYIILSFAITFSVDTNLTHSYNESSIVHVYTQPEKYVESDAPQIIATAQNIVEGETNPQEKALRIYDYVVNTLTYIPQPKEQGALWALENKAGDCSEFSYLFVALCRAVGIPARVKAGFAFQSESAFLSEGHMWAEYYLENYGWIPMDGSWRLFASLTNLHFSALQSIPQLTSYSSYLFNFTGTSRPQHSQTIALQKANTNDLGDPFARTLYALILENGKVENKLSLSKILGASFFFPAEVDKVIKALEEADLSLQKTMQGWESSGDTSHEITSTAEMRTETVAKLVENLILKTLFVDTAAFIIVVAILAALLAKRKREQPPYVVYDTTIDS
ncbi:MAG: transglutaminase-like domain-containing protein [Candidatus Bathyarchaeia archaeon]